MKEFMLVFRNAPVAQRDALTPEQLKDVSKPWQDWVGSIAAQDKLASIGGRLEFDGATVSSGIVTDGPYAEIKEIILGFIIIKAATKDEAVELAKGCPVLKDGGSVEVRGVVQMGN